MLNLAGAWGPEAAGGWVLSPAWTAPYKGSFCTGVLPNWPFPLGLPNPLCWRPSASPLTFHPPPRPLTPSTPLPCPQCSTELLPRGTQGCQLTGASLTRTLGIGFNRLSRLQFFFCLFVCFLVGGGVNKLFALSCSLVMCTTNL